MKMKTKTQTQIIEEIKKTEDITAVEIILDDIDRHINLGEKCAFSDSKNLLTPVKASVIINDKFFSIGYEIEDGYTFDFLRTLRKKVLPKDVLLFCFTDAELPKAWEQSYLAGGISVERYDSRVKFHPYNEMNEQFCIDRNLLWDLTDEFKGTPHELTKEKCAWKFNMVKWYQNHLI